MNAGFGEIPDKEKYTFTSFSRLQSLREDPEIYEAKYITKELETTASMEFGNLVDMAVLEPDKFLDNYLVLPEKTKENDLGKTQLEEILVGLGLKKSGNKSDLILRIREAMPDFPEQWDELVAKIDSAGKKMLSPVTLLKVQRIAQKLNNEAASSILKTGKKQMMGYWQDPKTGLVLRFKPDVFDVINGHGVCIDLKVTTDWDDRRFGNKHFDTGRHIQAAIYLDALTDITGTKFETFGWIAVEPNTPHRRRYYQADFGMIEAGRSERDYWLEDMAKRLEKNDWSPRPENKKFKETSLASWDWDKIPEVISE